MIKSSPPIPLHRVAGYLMEDTYLEENKRSIVTAGGVSPTSIHEKHHSGNDQVKIYTRSTSFLSILTVGQVMVGYILICSTVILVWVPGCVLITLNERDSIPLVPLCSVD